MLCTRAPTAVLVASQHSGPLVNVAFQVAVSVITIPVGYIPRACSGEGPEVGWAGAQRHGKKGSHGWEAGLLPGRKAP